MQKGRRRSRDSRVVMPPEPIRGRALLGADWLGIRIESVETLHGLKHVRLALEQRMLGL
jgi:hypothetical protein